MQEQYQLGRYFRQRYVDAGFLKPNYTKGDVSSSLRYIPDNTRTLAQRRNQCLAKRHFGRWRERWHKHELLPTLSRRCANVYFCHCWANDGPTSCHRWANVASTGQNDGPTLFRRFIGFPTLARKRCALWGVSHVCLICIILFSDISSEYLSRPHYNERFLYAVWIISTVRASAVEPRYKVATSTSAPSTRNRRLRMFISIV